MVFTKDTLKTDDELPPFMGVVSLFKCFHAIKYFEKVLTEAEKYATIIILTQRKYFNEKVFLIFYDFCVMLSTLHKL